jgi:S-adenosylmethionine hydrolase
MRANGIITLTTDFGLTDSYVGSMKGVILGIAPAARLVDITHAIEPQNIQQASYIVQTFYRSFPTGTVHLIIVDPGVGSQRRAIGVETPEAIFIAPDNGILAAIWHDAQARWGPQACAAVELTDRRFWRDQISRTFHGRDIFAPVAAHLAGGVPLAAFGPRLPAIDAGASTPPARGHHGELLGQIIHIDHFGNCITNITTRDLEQAEKGVGLVVEIAGQQISGLCATYADAPVGGLIALIGSSDQLELAIRNGNAAQVLGVGVGEEVRVR